MVLSIAILHKQFYLQKKENSFKHCYLTLTVLFAKREMVSSIAI